MKTLLNPFFGQYGGMYVGEILIPALLQLEKAFVEAKDDPAFRAELNDLMHNYAGRPTPITLCRNITKGTNTRIYLKREDLLHGGAHKTNQVLGQALLARRMGKTRIIAETGAGQHGVATAIVCALFGFKCRIYMGITDVKRQEPNVFRMRLMGAEVVPVTTGVGTLKEMGGGNATTVYTICTTTMGKFGTILAMLGVIACPITSGDTAFRSARLTLADWFKLDMSKWTTRLALCIPVLGIGAFLGFGNTLGFIDYQIIWRYFSWSNQTLAMIVLWAGAMFLASEKKNYWIAAVPAVFMSAVSSTYFIMAPECLGMIPALTNNKTVAYPCGIIIAVLFLVIFLRSAKNASSKSFQ